MLNINRLKGCDRMFKFDMSIKDYTEGQHVWVEYKGNYACRGVEKFCINKVGKKFIYASPLRNPSLEIKFKLVDSAHGSRFGNDAGGYSSEIFFCISREEVANRKEKEKLIREINDYASSLRSLGEYEVVDLSVLREVVRLFETL